MVRHGVVIDTNVLIAGALSRSGPPATIVNAILDETLHLLVDDRIINEYEEVFRRPRFSKVHVRLTEILDFIHLFGIAVPVHNLDIALPDPDDLPFLEVAAFGRVHLVTGNETDYKPKRGHHTVEIISPRKFVDGVLPSLMMES